MDTQRIKRIFEEIEQDCEQLKKEGQLTEFGKAQLSLSKKFKENPQAFMAALKEIEQEKNNAISNP